MMPPTFSLAPMTCCSVLALGLLGSFIMHYITSLHGPRTSIIRLKETISIAVLGTAWAMSSDRSYCSAVKVNMVTTTHVASQDDMIVIILY